MSAEVVPISHATSYQGNLIRCRDCDRPASTYIVPNVDHRRRRETWPQSYGLCAEHERTTR